MTRSRGLLIGAALANMLGWALPVVQDYRGVHAFRVALSPIWPYEHFSIPSGQLVVLSVASAATNVLFVTVTMAAWAGLVASRARQRLMVWVVGAAALLNLHWPLSMGDSASGLRAGYYVWVLSFVLLLLAVHPALSARSR
jgi:hypothetical protein